MIIQVKIGILAFLLALIAMPLQAADQNDDVVEYRQRVMQGVGASMGSIGDILKGKVSYSALMPHYARTINEYAQTVSTIFKQNTKGTAKKTRAKDDIWANWADFEQKAQDLVDASAGMVAAAESGDMGKIGAAMKTLGGSCGGCHKNFREKE